MQTKQAWPPELGEDIRLPPPSLPSAPRIRRDACRWCGSVHTSHEQAVECRSANAGEQR